MTSAGDLTQKVTLSRREAVSDGAGNAQADFVYQFQRRAAFIYAGGKEHYEAGRLAGHAVMKIRLRNDSDTRRIASDWRLTDARRGTVYNIRAVDAVTNAQWVYLVVESGVP